MLDLWFELSHEDPCLLSSLLVMEKYMEYVSGVCRGSACDNCDLMIAEAVLRNEIG